MIAFRTAAVLSTALTLASVARAQQPQQHPDRTTMNQMEQAGTGGTAMDDQARSHFRVGLSLYQEGRFRDSAPEFQAAYDLSHRAQLLYNVYLAWRDAGDVPKATVALRGFLGQTPDDGTDTRRQLTARLASMEQTVAQQQTQNAQQEQHATETAAQLEAERQARLAAEHRAEEAHRLASQRDTRPLGPSIPGIVIGGVGLVSVLTGIIIGSVGLSQKGDLDTMCGTMHSCPASAAGTVDSIRLLTGLGDGLWIGGAALAALGLVLFLTHAGSSREGPPPAAPPPVTATAMCTSTGCTGSLVGSF